MSFIVKRHHAIGDGWTLYRYFNDHDLDGMIRGEVIATSSGQMDNNRVATNRRMLAQDIMRGRVEIRGVDTVFDKS